MEQEGARRFALATHEIPAGEVHNEMEKVQLYLARYGYLAGPYETKRLDRPTQDALRAFQEYVGVSPTGTVDDVTATVLEQYRCGNPDRRPRGRAKSGVPPAFVLRGCSYQAQFRTLTYTFTVGSGDLAGREEKLAVQRAFATWQQQIPVDFVEVGVTNNPNFRIGWFAGNHGDNSPFDGVGNTLAHAFYPPPCGGTFAGHCHFDEAETWALAHGGGNIDLETVALHEIGHLLGLDHSNVAGSVMFPTYAGQRRALAADDIAGIRALYGRRGPTLDVLVHLQDLGDQTFRENELAGTRGQARRLEGFQLQLSPPVPGLSMRYMAHLQGIGDVPFVNEGRFIGTRGQSRRLEGFAIQLTGSAAANFNVFYMAHLEGSGDTAVFRNGQFCGTRGQSRRVEAILVRVEPV